MSEFAIAEVMPGKLNALVKNIMRQTGEADPNEAVRLVNSGQWVVSQPNRLWREKNGIIYFWVTSDGTTGEEWVRRFKKKNFHVDDKAENLLLSPDFRPTSGVTTEIAIFKGAIFDEDNRITDKVRAFADGTSSGKFVTPNAEVACLVRDMFSDEDVEEMGLGTIVVMHEPIKNSKGLPLLFIAYCGERIRCLSACYNYNGSRLWSRKTGFVLAVSEARS